MNKSDMSERDNKIIYKKPQKYLGPSQFAAALDLSNYQSSQELKKRIEEGFWKTIRPRMTFGISKEKMVLEHCKQEMGWSIKIPKWKTLSKHSRIGGIADGLIYENEKVIAGIEIKCHPYNTIPLKNIPIEYLLQIVGYMVLYDLKEWKLVSVCFNGREEIYDLNVLTIKWDEVKESWEKKWYPRLIKFVNSISWSN